MGTFDVALAFNFYHSGKKFLGAFRGISPEVALTDLGSHQFACTRYTKSLGCRFMGLQLVFLDFAFLRHDFTPIIQIPR